MACIDLHSNARSDQEIDHGHHRDLRGSLLDFRFWNSRHSRPKSSPLTTTWLTEPRRSPVDYKARTDLTERERLVLIETMLGCLQQDLFGNGQPGVLADLTSRIEKVEGLLEGRIEKLERSDTTRTANAGGQRTIWMLLLLIATLAVSVIGLFLVRH